MERKAREAKWKMGRAERNFTTSGAYEMVLRTIASGVSAAAFGLAAGCDVYGAKVLRWSHKLRAAQLESFKEFVIRGYLELERGDPRSEDYHGIRFVLHVIGADATSANVMLRRKLHLTLVKSIFGYANSSLLDVG